MAIGFIVTNITDKVLPDKTLAMSSKPNVLVAKFGDGYQQRIAAGLNSITESFSVAFQNRPKVEADDIEAFFSAKKGVTSFAFTYPDTNSTSTATAVVNGAVNNSTAVTLDAATTNVNISAGATITGTGISGTVTVSSISGTALVLSSAQTISNDVVLTFSNPNEREVKVICPSWNVTFSNSDHYNVNGTFERVYEP
jgi:phage-related protein|tara:strand:- start:11900 stop:12490 length:591 start_codon:yes stop_codon:yes gene_type:complete